MIINKTPIADDVLVHCSHDEIIDITTLVPNPRNPNQHPDKQIELLAKIIKNQGWRAPITVSTRSGFIVRGHGRLMAAQLLGLSVVPVDRQDYASEAEEWADLIADNRIAELSQVDDTLLANLLSDINMADFDVNLTGFSDKQIDNLLADFNATVRSDVEKLMAGSQADMVFTDPPYNVAYEGGTVDKLTIKNDNMPAEQFNRFLHDAFASMIVVTEPGGAIYVCHADTVGANFRSAMMEAGWFLKQCLIWVKNQFVMGRQDYQWQHEPILYGWKPGAAHRWYGGRKQCTVVEEAAPFIVKQDGEGALITFTTGIQTVTIRVPAYEILSSGDDSLSTVWRFEKPLRNGEHPTMKPIGLCARAIQNSSRPDEIVADFFGGSGSTLMAAEQTGRTCYMMELDPVYCDVIVKRWEEFTSHRACKVQ